MPAASDSPRHLLTPHPASQQGGVREIAVSVECVADVRLELSYRLVGDLESLQLPEPRSSVRTDGLWRHTCFEAFIGQPGGGEYWEYNFSPSGAWAAYRFAAYREGMAPLMRGTAPTLRREEDVDSLMLAATLDLSWMCPPGARRPLRLGLAAVIENRSRELSWWALAHPAGKPDFHHADGFVIELGSPATSKLEP
jgi:hypothetical protein